MQAPRTNIQAPENHQTSKLKREPMLARLVLGAWMLELGAFTVASVDGESASERVSRTVVKCDHHVLSACGRIGWDGERGKHGALRRVGDIRAADCACERNASDRGVSGRPGRVVREGDGHADCRSSAGAASRYYRGWPT